MDRGACFGAKEKAARWGAALGAGVAFRGFGRKDRFDRGDRADRRNRGDRWNFGAIPSGVPCRAVSQGFMRGLVSGDYFGVVVAGVVVAGVVVAGVGVGGAEDGDAGGGVVGVEAVPEDLLSSAVVFEDGVDAVVVGSGLA